MPPRSRYRDLTPEQLEELDSLITPREPVPRLPVDATASRTPRVSIGEARFLDAPGSGIRDDLLQIEVGDDPDEAWLDSLIATPPQAPRALSAAGPAGATYEGVDTPQGREFVKSRGMQVTSTPTDEDLLEALASERPATMPDLGGDDLDELIRAEGAAMDREQQGASGVNGGGVYSAQPRQSREDALREMLQPPTRTQGMLAVLGDALYGGNMVDNVNARGRQYQGALAQARMQDIQAGERSDERAADREMTDERLRLMMRGQDLASERAGESRELRLQLEQQRDQRMREEGAKARDAAMERTRVNAASRAGTPLTPEAERDRTIGFLAAQANTSEAEAEAFIAGNTDGIAPEKLERLRINHKQYKGLSPRKQEEVVAGGMRREGATPDQIEADRKKQQQNVKQRADYKESFDEIGRTIATARAAWKKMSPPAQKAFASLASGGFTGTIKQGLLTPEEQKAAAAVQALANGLVKNLGGSAVSAPEWGRIASSIGFPVNDFSPFNSPEGIGDWIERSHRGLMGRIKAVESEYGNLWEEDNAAP